MQTQASRWGALVGSRILSVAGDGAGHTEISLQGASGRHTVTVARTRGLWSTLHRTPSGAIERVTPVFTDGQAMVRLETDLGEELMVAGGGAWLGPQTSPGPDPAP